jgi:hypothetical protein
MNKNTITLIGGSAPYIVIINSLNKKWWNTDSSEFETYDSANWAYYAISATQYANSSVWTVIFPADVPSGTYDVVQIDKSGSTPAYTDRADANGTVFWDGTNLDQPEQETVVIPPSDPGFVTGYLHCYDEDGLFAVGATVQLQMTSLPNAGLSFSTNVRSETSDENGIVSFTNLVPGATYNLRRGITTVWTSVTIDEDAEDPVALDALLGHDSCT